MHEENEILTQIRALRQEVGSRLDDMDKRLRKIEAEVAAPAIEGLGSRLEIMEERLRRMEAEMTAPVAFGGPAVPERAIELAPPIPTHTVEVTVDPLYDVSHVRVVEAALTAIEGVQSVTLLTLSGNVAKVAVEAEEGVSLIGGLRRTLPVAFDVSESDSSSFTLGLVQPGVERTDGVPVRQVKAT